jgi:AcrR family transcriptional regulator
MIGKRSPEKSVTEVRLVEAAAQLFARQGFKATTTKEIAQLADLNEATLFRYFPRKPDLFMAALESYLGRIKLSRDLHASLGSDDDPVLVVPKIVEFISSSLTAHPEVRRLLHVARFELSEADTIVRESLGPIFDLLRGYFKRSADKGSICNVEPSCAALWLLGGVAAHQSFCELFTSERPQPLDGNQAIAVYTALCLHGLRPTADVISNS